MNGDWGCAENVLVTRSRSGYAGIEVWFAMMLRRGQSQLLFREVEDKPQMTGVPLR